MLRVLLCDISSKIYHWFDSRLPDHVIAAKQSSIMIRGVDWFLADDLFDLESLLLEGI